MTQKLVLGWAIPLGLAALHCSGGDPTVPELEAISAAGAGSGASSAGQGGTAGSLVSGNGGTTATASAGFGFGGQGNAAGAGGLGGSASGAAGTVTSAAGAGAAGAGGAGASGGQSSLGGGGAGLATAGTFGFSGGASSGGVSSGGMGAAGMASAFAPVAELISMSCGTSQCHPNRMGNHMDLHDTDGTLFTRLMGSASGNMIDAECQNRPLVVPGDPAGSLLVQMIEAPDAPRAECGERMPHDCVKENACLTDADIQTVKTWIQNGALP